MSKMLTKGKSNKPMMSFKITISQNNIAEKVLKSSDIQI